VALFSKSIIPDDFVKLSLYGSFTRGIATGANDFFALKKTNILKVGLDDKNICRCITKSAHIRKPIFTEEDFKSLYEQDKAVYCLNVTDSERGEVQKYIKQGEKLGYHKRYPTRKRSPWYKTE
jgi:adenine-specific DNA-methyltransferase